MPPDETTSATTQETTPAPAAAPAATGGDFSSLIAGLPADLRDNPSLKPIKDFPSLAKSYVEAQQLIGTKRLESPQPNWSEAQWEAFYSQLGRPGAADQYAFLQAVDPQMKETPLMKGMLPAMHKAGLTEKQASGIVQEFLGLSQTMQKQAQENAKTAATATAADLQKRWGQAYEAKLEQANVAAASLFGDKLESVRTMQLSDGSYLMDSSVMLEMLAAIGESMGEDPQLTPGSRVRHTLTPEEATMEYNTKMSDPAFLKQYMDRGDPMHQWAVDLMERLTEMRYAKGAPPNASTNYAGGL